MAERQEENNENEWAAYGGAEEGNGGDELNESMIDRLCGEFVRFIENYLLANLFTLSAQTLWTIYLQLHMYFTAYPYTGPGWQPAPNPSPVHDEDDDEPPTLTREK